MKYEGKVNCLYEGCVKEIIGLPCLISIMAKIFWNIIDLCAAIKIWNSNYRFPFGWKNDIFTWPNVAVSRLKLIFLCISFSINCIDLKYFLCLFRFYAFPVLEIKIPFAKKISVFNLIWPLTFRFSFFVWCSMTLFSDSFELTFSLLSRIITGFS